MFLEVQAGMSKPHHHSSHPVWNDPRLERLVANALPGAEVLKVSSLKADAVTESATAKDAGYGSPLRIDVRRAAA